MKSWAVRRGHPAGRARALPDGPSASGRRSRFFELIVHPAIAPRGRQFGPMAPEKFTPRLDNRVGCTYREEGS